MVVYDVLKEYLVKLKAHLVTFAIFLAIVEIQIGIQRQMEHREETWDFRGCPQDAVPPKITAS
jgi:hypothetical protein